MKIYLKFNHQEDTLIKALDCPVTAKELNNQLQEIFMRFMSDDNLQSQSELSEMIHNEVDYSAILYMATKYLSSNINKIMITGMLREMLEDDEDI